MLPDLDVAAVPRDELPRLLGEVARLEAEIRLRLAEVPAAPARESRLLDQVQAGQIADTTPRWLNRKTRGMGFRRDLSRKQVRYDEGGLREWLSTRRAR